MVWATLRPAQVVLSSPLTWDCLHRSSSCRPSVAPFPCVPQSTIHFCGAGHSPSTTAYLKYNCHSHFGSRGCEPRSADYKVHNVIHWDQIQLVVLWADQNKPLKTMKNCCNNPVGAVPALCPTWKRITVAGWHWNDWVHSFLTKYHFSNPSNRITLPMDGRTIQRGSCFLYESASCSAKLFAKVYVFGLPSSSLNRNQCVIVTQT